jgi:hypothetical protein
MVRGVRLMVPAQEENSKIVFETFLTLFHRHRNDSLARKNS